MNPTAHIHFDPTELHPRDALAFDLYAHAPKKSRTKTARTWWTTLPVEKTYSEAPAGKRPPLAPDTPEAQVIVALRKAADGCAKPQLVHALRCLATCLDNYSRYGNDEALNRMLSLAYHLHLNHSSKPYRSAFGEAYAMLQEQIRGMRMDTETTQGTSACLAAPQRVFYLAVTNLHDNHLPPVRIRLFDSEHHARACLTDWLKQYGIPFEVWRSLRGVMADELLPYTQDGLFVNIGEKQIKSRPIL